MLTMRQLHQRFHESTGVTFASLYPGQRLAHARAAMASIIIMNPLPLC